MTSDVAPIVSQFCVKPRAGTAVLVGEYPTANPFTHIAAAMRSQGWDVAEVDFRSHLGNPGNRWVNAIADRLLPQARMKSLAAEIEAAVAGTGADVVLFAKGLGATPAMLERLRARGCRSVCWYPDRDFEHLCVDERAVSHFDLFITTKQYHLDYLESVRGGRPTILIEHGWAPGVHWRMDPPIPPDKRPFDVVFVGNHSSYKQG
jgi:spore maturation protein CgeB